MSEDLEVRREQYTQLMREHSNKSRDEIVASVRETQEALLQIFSSASIEQAMHKPAADEWSLHELALHAVFTERLIAKLIHHTARGSRPSAEDLEGAGIGMMPEGDDRPYADVIDDLQATSEKLLEAIRALPDAPDIETKLAHPFFGPLNCYEWAGFQRVHDTDHIQHARKILATI